LKKLVVIAIVGGMLGAAAMVIGTKVTEDPLFCAGCHPMRPYHFSLQSSAHADLICNDCHVPRIPIIRQLYEGKSGAVDAIAYYITGYADVLHPKADTKRIVKANCLHCHGELMHLVDTEGRRCVECHRSVPHGELRTLQNANWPREL